MQVIETPAFFGRFPKIRPVLPVDFEEIYELHYKNNREGKTRITSISLQMEKWLHRKVAEDTLVKSFDKRTLEIGAGTLNQLRYEPNITNYDIVEPFVALYETSVYLPRLSNIFSSIHDIKSSEKYDRITAIASFEHILDLPVVVAKAALHLETPGSMRIAVPNEGSILWKLGTLVTGLEFWWMYNLDYQILIRHEHVNSADEIENILRYFFKTTSTQVLGFSKRYAFYRYIECSVPEIDRAKNFLNDRIMRQY